MKLSVMHAHTCMHTHAHTQAHKHKCTHAHTHKRTHTHAHTQAHTHTQMHMHTRAHTHTHTHMISAYRVKDCHLLCNNLYQDLILVWTISCNMDRFVTYPGIAKFCRAICMYCVKLQTRQSHVTWRWIEPPGATWTG